MGKSAGIGTAMLLVALLAVAGMAKKAPKPPVKVLLSPASTVASADLVKYFQQRCPNVTITLAPKESNYMLEAGGWPGHYRFTVFRKGGDAVFATSTVFLTNAVKDVCKYVNRAPQAAKSGKDSEAIVSPSGRIRKGAHAALRGGAS